MYIYDYTHARTYIHQGRWKLFLTGYPKLNPEDYSTKCVGG